jgi:hypothetical protein
MKIPAALSNTQLKIIAIISMLTDHICMVLYPADGAAYMIRLTIGRIAMPVFAFLLCEGFFHTRSRFKYGRNLLIFAVISEPFFDFACSQTFFNPAHQNVFFTLFAALVMLVILDKLTFNNTILQIPVVAAFILAAWLLKLDNDVAVIAIATVFYFFHWHNFYLQCIIACTVSALVNGTPGIFLALIPMTMYNGKRGRTGTFLKYFFYAFYPLHLAVLSLLR